MRLRIVQVEHDFLWTDLTGSSLILFVACKETIEVMSEIRIVSEAYPECELVNIACVASVQMTGTVIAKPQGRLSCTGREAKLAKCGFSIDCEGCRVAASGNEASRLHDKECRKCIGLHMKMRDDVGQQRLLAVEERLAPAASAARAEGAQKGQASLAKIDAAQEFRDVKMSEAFVKSDAENVKLPIEETREDLTEVTSRKDNWHRPRLAADPSVLPSRK